MPASGVRLRVHRWLILCACVATCHPASDPGGGASTWRDPSPHASQMVSIAPGVGVEVLDWGGHGPPLVFLAGLGDTPHVYDDFAPAFTDRFHVVGITRRGFGHSTGLPDTTVAALVEDLRVVLDSLRLSRVILVGHSIAGEELTGFGATYPDRCEALVYLDAATDRSGSDTHGELAATCVPSSQVPVARRLCGVGFGRGILSVVPYPGFGRQTGCVQLFPGAGPRAAGGHRPVPAQCRDRTLRRFTTRVTGSSSRTARGP